MAKIKIEDGKLVVPDKVDIPFIEGDGTGPDISRAAKLVFDSAVQKAYGGKRKVNWVETLAGESAYKRVGEWLPEETIEKIKEHVVAIKGPLTTPVGGGIRSLNVTLRQIFDLYACIRPVKYFKGIPSPLRYPEKVDAIVFRENTEDVYAGIEWRYDSPEAEKFRKFLKEEFGIEIREDSGIGVKPISEFATRRLMRKAINYAREKGRKSITIMHKGNIMKFTEGAFREWCYKTAKEEFPEITITEAEVAEGKSADGKIVIKDRIADNMFQQILTRPGEYDIIICPNLNGDYISDALAGLVGGLGVAPGANIGDHYAIFEATHGTAPKYAGLDKVNPTSLILSGAMMFEYIGWTEVSRLIHQGLERTFAKKIFTYDLARHDPEAKEVKCSEFAKAVVDNM